MKNNRFVALIDRLSFGRGLVNSAWTRGIEYYIHTWLYARARVSVRFRSISPFATSASHSPNTHCGRYTLSARLICLISGCICDKKTAYDVGNKGCLLAVHTVETKSLCDLDSEQQEGLGTVLTAGFCTVNGQQQNNLSPPQRELSRVSGARSWKLGTSKL